MRTEPGQSSGFRLPRLEIPRSVARQLERLGGSIDASFTSEDLLDEGTWRRSDGDDWEGEDPEGDLEAISDTIVALAGVDWEGECEMPSTTQRGAWDPVRLGGFQEHYDVEFEGQRVLFFVVARNESSEYLYGVDLLDTDEDPRLYGAESESWDEVVAHDQTLSAFLGTLRS